MWAWNRYRYAEGQAHDDENPSSLFHYHTAPTSQASRGKEVSISAIPHAKGRVVQDPWIQASFVGERLHRIWIPEQFHPFCLLKQKDLRLELVKSGQNGNPSLAEPGVSRP